MAHLSIALNWLNKIMNIMSNLKTLHERKITLPTKQRGIVIESSSEIIPLSTNEKQECRQSNETGSAMVEMVIVLPFLLMLLFIATEFGQFSYFSIEVANAAHAGAQFGASSPTNAANISGMQQAALNDASDVSGLSSTASSFCRCSSGGGNVACLLTSCSGSSRLIQYVKVNTKATLIPWFSYPPISTAFAPLVSPNSFNATAIMRVSQ